MTVIGVVATDQLLTVALKPKIAAGDINSVRLQVEFDSEWNDYAKSAVFYTDKDATVYEVILDTDNACIVPHEVLAEAGALFIGLRGVYANQDGAYVKTSTLVKYKIDEGAPVGEGTSFAPTASVYQQILTELEKANHKSDPTPESIGAATAESVTLLDKALGETNEAVEGVKTSVQGLSESTDKALKQLESDMGNAAKELADDITSLSNDVVHNDDVGNANGVPSLDETAKIPIEQIPTDEFLMKSGGTMTGMLELSEDPSTDMHAATKRYVDEATAPIKECKLIKSVSLSCPWGSTSSRTEAVTFSGPSKFIIFACDSYELYSYSVVVKTNSGLTSALAVSDTLYVGDLGYGFIIEQVGDGQFATRLAQSNALRMVVGPAGDYIANLTITINGRPTDTGNTTISGKVYATEA